jgi:hypothetical protein
MRTGACCRRAVSRRPVLARRTAPQPHNPRTVHGQAHDAVDALCLELVRTLIVLRHVLAAADARVCTCIVDHTRTHQAGPVTGACSPCEQGALTAQHAMQPAHHKHTRTRTHATNAHAPGRPNSTTFLPATTSRSFTACGSPPSLSCSRVSDSSSSGSLSPLLIVLDCLTAVRVGVCVLCCVCVEPGCARGMPCGHGGQPRTAQRAQPNPTPSQPLTVKHAIVVQLHRLPLCVACGGQKVGGSHRTHARRAHTHTVVPCMEQRWRATGAACRAMHVLHT